MQLHGAWPDAVDAAQRACERLRPRAQPAVGAAFYQRAELHRLLRRVRAGRGGVPPGQPVGTRAAARPGAAAAGAGAGRCRRGGDPSRGRWRRGPGRRGPGCCRRTSRSCSPRVMSSPPAPPPRSCRSSAADLDAPLLRALATHAAGRRAAARGRRAGRARHAARGVDGVAAARGAVRGGPRPRPDRARLPAARRHGDRGDGARRGGLGLRAARRRARPRASAGALPEPARRQAG